MNIGKPLRKVRREAPRRLPDRRPPPAPEREREPVEQPEPVTA